MAKKFDAWNSIKKKIDRRDYGMRFREREIWWCSLGLNVDCEQDGKNATFNRPVLVVRKFNRDMFWGVPLSRISKDNPFYVAIELEEMTRYAIISQMRLLASKRLQSRIVRIPEAEQEKVKKALRTLLE